MDDLLTRYENILATQRLRGSSPSLQQASNELAAAYFDAIPVVATQRSSRNRFNRYSSWCEARLIPAWPIVGSVVALSIHDLASGDQEGGKAYDSHTTVLNALRRVTEPVWAGKPDCDEAKANLMSFEPLREFCSVARAAALKKRAERSETSTKKEAAGALTSPEGTPSKRPAARAKKTHAAVTDSPLSGRHSTASTTTPRKTPASNRKSKTPISTARTVPVPPSQPAVASTESELLPAGASEPATPAKARISRKRKAEDVVDEATSPTVVDIEPSAKRVLLSPPESARRSRRATASPSPKEADPERKTKRKYVRKNINVTSLDMAATVESKSKGSEPPKKTPTPRKKKAALDVSSFPASTDSLAKSGGRPVEAVKEPIVNGFATVKEAITDLVADNKTPPSDAENAPTGIGMFGKITRWFGWGS